MFLQRRSATAYLLVSGMLLLAEASSPLASSQVSAKPQSSSPVRPLQVALIAPLDLTHVHQGSPVFAHVLTAWSDSNCVLQPGSVVKGHVAALTKRSRLEKNSSLQLLFDKADCKNNPDISPAFDIQALVGPIAYGASNAESGVTEGPPLSNELPLTIGGVGGGIRNANAASALTDTFVLPVRNLPSQILPGEVIDVAKTHLSVGTGIEGATVVSAFGRDVRLETGTTFVLTPKLAIAARTTFSGAAKTSTPAGASASPAPPPDPPDITDICSAACTSVTNNNTETKPLSNAVGSIQLDRFGYPSPSQREMAHFNRDTAVVYLGAGHLLCTFDPHHLRERSETEGESYRTVRAVLVNTSDFSVQRVFEWRVRGNGQYLWQLSSGHLLVHLGRELKEFDTDLKPLRSIHLEGRLAWVTTSPSGNHIAVGTVRERYSLAFRDALAQTFSDEPEEDIVVHVFDDNFQLLMAILQSSHTVPPVLSDSGEIRVQHEARGRWRISEITWTREEHVLAISRSACRPTLSAPEHGLLFMTGCASTGGRWYKILHEDGHPVLKGESASNELELSIQASTPGIFALRTVEASRAFDSSQPFRPSDLTRERVAVFSSETGTRLASLSSDDFALAEQGFALSPAGDQVVLVGRSALHFYPLNHRPQ